MAVDGSLSAETVRRWMGEAAAAIAVQRDYLTQLDAAIGDADHGTNMARGFAAVEDRLAELDGGTPPGEVLVVVGQTLVSTVGGASGPLWGTAMRRAGKSLKDEETVTPAALGEALQAAVDGVIELGAAQPGDKTMVDALAPAVDAFRSAVAAGRPLANAASEAESAAEDGMRSTVPMLARKGRASYLGERSIGHQDPGATSAVIIVGALVRAVAADT
jgi:phosphoenolpyruvate---glycerone phosphotransferase subunit DhaL